MAIFEGAGVALITPMNEDFSVNYDKLEEIIEEQIAGGTDCIIICGTTGEASTLTVEEHLDVIKRTVEMVNRRIPVIAGTGSNSTETAVEFSKEAQKYGSDGVLVVSPYYNKATQKGLIRHFSEIANSIYIPVLLYNIPGRTGVNIEPETIAYLVNSVSNIVGVKEASGNFSNAVKILRLCPEIDMYSGNDDQVVPLMSIGAKGVISVLSNVAPRQTHDMCRAALDGDFVKARKMQIEALDVIENLFTEVNPIPVKAAMNLQGKNVGPLRLPLTQMEKPHEDVLAKAMKEYGIL
ncbi:4-hydroxy-tetrahydrodipicolinate synthase [Lachnoanaerobaculum sp. Marseille-Q4761]|jgi:dihydrodipicolinate synthase|uniref:4-hydroxy-tetrahydrodipicolinate synthase n=1 Tax=Lachnoanaerobaculum sp. Marseille-Q4761 TaxID=2819511 RepID=UPI001AA15120|nr:4-hydroxy-tetrahydrodipicolinate synthase [Lachnoanaerobaculum sp. Marseille-Q4761]MBO1871846.1 4-hydroxy-tetrahydrodipicolinate synthase [Lachnoanaerobaculum sp. Marseille-Q4761]